MTASASPFFTRSLLAVMIAQFFAAFGDNMLLFATLALLKQAAYPDWSHPLLQVVFVTAYILLAPFVGQLADQIPKGRVMLYGNLARLVGTALICFGTSPFLGYALVGVGATLYSPAKYGILGELTQDAHLVKANGLLEGSTIIAILTGSVAGGMLADWRLSAALFVCLAAFILAAVANLFIPVLPAPRAGQGRSPGAMLRHFSAACRQLWQDRLTRFSLLGTALFWGAGVTLRFMLVAWVPIALGMTDNTTPTLLNAMVAIGIVLGAGLAARLVTLDSVTRCMPAGIFIGVLVVALALQHSLFGTYLLLIAIGVLGGFFVVPLNALLQERGKHSTGAGNAIAIQNLGENCAMLLMLGIYTLAIRLAVPVIAVGVGFGALFALAIALLWLTYRRRMR